MQDEKILMKGFNESHETIVYIEKVIRTYGGLGCFWIGPTVI